MGLIDLLCGTRHERRLEALAGQIASDSQAAVQQRLRADVVQLGRGELRGYIRARAAAVVHHEVERLMATQPQILRKSQPELVQRATNQVVQRLAHELFFTVPLEQRRRAA